MSENISKSEKNNNYIDPRYVLTSRRRTQSFNRFGQQEGNKTQKLQEAYKNQSFSENICKLEKKYGPKKLKIRRCVGVNNGRLL